MDSGNIDGVYLRQLVLPAQWPPMTSFACPGAFDPIENAKAAIKLYAARYVQAGPPWETYSNGEVYPPDLWGRRWPLSPGPRSMHGDALLASPACSSHVS